MCFLFIVSFFLLLSPSYEDATDDATRLRRHLLQNYTPLIRPVKDLNKPVNISILFLILQIIELDPYTDTLTADVSLIFRWKDEFIHWTPSDFGGLEICYFNIKEIWTPELLLENTNNGDDVLNKDRDQIIIADYEGYIIWRIYLQTSTSCDQRVSDFPFDVQTCYIIIESYVYHQDQLHLTNYASENNTNGIYGPYYENPKWRVKSINAKAESFLGTYSFVSYTFKLARKSDIHLYFILLPYLGATLLGFATFFTPIGSNLRYIFGGIAVYILINMLLSVSSIVTYETNEVPYPAQCISLNILFISLSLIITNLVYQVIINMAVACPPLPSILVNQLKNPLLGKICFLPNLKAQQQQSPSQDSNFDGIAQIFLSDRSRAVLNEWILLIKFLDRLFLLLYAIIIILYHS